jgi:phosphohistidine phosphatase
MRELYLIRHGIAVDRSLGLVDGERPLTATGQRRTLRVGQRLVELGIRCDRLLSSPLVRARQTASLLVEAHVAPEIEICPALQPGGDLRQGLQQMARTDWSRLALVGHEPDLGLWAETLIWSATQEKLIVKKSGVIGLLYPPSGDPIGQCQLFWLAPPRLLI